MTEHFKLPYKGTRGAMRRKRGLDLGDVEHPEKFNMMMNT